MIYFFCSYKNGLLLVWQELLKTANDRYHNCGGNEKDAKYYFENKDVFKEKCKY